MFEINFDTNLEIKYRKQIVLLINLKAIYLSGFTSITAFAVFRKPNAIPPCFSIDV
jgi:hypothetical protein